MAIHITKRSTQPHSITEKNDNLTLKLCCFFCLNRNWSYSLIMVSWCVCTLIVNCTLCLWAVSQCIGFTNTTRAQCTGMPTQIYFSPLCLLNYRCNWLDSGAKRKKHNSNNNTLPKTRKKTMYKWANKTLFVHMTGNDRLFALWWQQQQQHRYYQKKKTKQNTRKN